jgi:hypothetical protein
VLAAVPRLTGHAPDSRAARRRGPVLQGLPKDGQSHLLPQVLGCLAPMAHHLSAMGLHGITLDPRAIPAALKDMVGEVCESLCLSQVSNLKAYHCARQYVCVFHCCTASIRQHVG